MTNEKFEIWANAVKLNKRRRKTFNGVGVHELDTLEKIFKTSIDIFRLNEDRTVSPIHLSLSRYSNKVTLNGFRNHLSYVKNSVRYCQNFRCRGCDYLFSHIHHLRRHEKSHCLSGVVKIKYPGKYFVSPPSIFEEIARFGVRIPQELHFLKMSPSGIWKRY